MKTKIIDLKLESLEGMSASELLEVDKEQRAVIKNLQNKLVEKDKDTIPKSEELMSLPQTKNTFASQLQEQKERIQKQVKATLKAEAKSIRKSIQEEIAKNTKVSENKKDNSDDESWDTSISEETGSSGEEDNAAQMKDTRRSLQNLQKPTPLSSDKPTEKASARERLIEIIKRQHSTIATLNVLVEATRREVEELPKLPSKDESSDNLPLKQNALVNVEKTQNQKIHKAGSLPKTEETNLRELLKSRLEAHKQALKGTKGKAKKTKVKSSTEDAKKPIADLNLMVVKVVKPEEPVSEKDDERKQDTVMGAGSSATSVGEKEERVLGVAVVEKTKLEPLKPPTITTTQTQLPEKSPPAAQTGVAALQEKLAKLFHLGSLSSTTTTFPPPIRKPLSGFKTNQFSELTKKMETLYSQVRQVKESGPEKTGKQELEKYQEKEKQVTTLELSNKVAPSETLFSLLAQHKDLDALQQLMKEEKETLNLDIHIPHPGETRTLLDYARDYKCAETYEYLITIKQREKLQEPTEKMFSLLAQKKDEDAYELITNQPAIVNPNGIHSGDNKTLLMYARTYSCKKTEEQLSKIDKWLKENLMK